MRCFHQELDSIRNRHKNVRQEIGDLSLINLHITKLLEEEEEALKEGKKHIKLITEIGLTLRKNGRKICNKRKSRIRWCGVTTDIHSTLQNTK